MYNRAIQPYGPQEEALSALPTLVQDRMLARLIKRFDVPGPSDQFKQPDDLLEKYQEQHLTNRRSQVDADILK